MVFISFNVKFYKTADGKSPVKDFITSQDKKVRNKIERGIAILRELGNNLRMPHSEYLQDDIFQLRVQSGNDISRVLYFFYDGQDIILTNGFIKKTQETPPKEIAKAKKYRNDYIERMDKNEITDI